MTKWRPKFHPIAPRPEDVALDGAVDEIPEPPWHRERQDEGRKTKVCEPFALVPITHARSNACEFAAGEPVSDEPTCFRCRLAALSSG